MVFTLNVEPPKLFSASDEFVEDNRSQSPPEVCKTIFKIAIVFVR